MSSVTTRRWAAILAVAAVVVIGAAGAARALPVAASEPLPIQADPQVIVPSAEEVQSVLARASAARSRAAAPAAPQALQQDLILMEQFEGATFPPDGWEVIDKLVTAGPAQWVWGRQTCEVPTQGGGTAAAWSVGGGAQGGQLACWTPYSQPVHTHLLYGNIDTSNFAGGIRVNFVFKADTPRDGVFRICWASSTNNGRCYTYSPSEEQQNRWLQPADPLLKGTGGMNDVSIWFRYEDANPDGASMGVIIDNVMIEGLQQEATDEPTSAPTTPRPTRTPAATARPRPGQNIFMPLTLKRIATENFPPPTPGPEWNVEAEMGSSDTGEFVPGKVFPVGTMGLCSHVMWTDLPVGTQIRWLWYADGEPIAPDNTQLNQTIAVEESTGESEFTCIQYSNSQTGEQFPLPEGTYSVDVWVDQVAEGDPVYTTASVIIGTEPPPGRTLIAEMGTRDDNSVFTPGTMYQFGVMQLCMRLQWWNQPIGTEMRWQWFADGEPILPDDTDLNPTFQVETEHGQRFSCIIAQENGQPIPIPEATFRVDVWMDQVAEGDPVYTSAQAVVGAEGTPAPETPTPAPTRVPGTYTCRDVMVNGNFEQGAGVGWAMNSNVEVDGQPLAPDHIIRNNDDFDQSDPAFEGQWLAILGDDPDFDMRMYLFQANGVPLIDASRIVTAELQYVAALITDEVRNGTNDDTFAAVVVNQDDQMQGIQGTGFSEETIEAQKWWRFRVDVTQLMTARSGWTSARFGFGSEINSSVASLQLVDAAKLTVCEATSADALAVPRGGSGGVTVTPLSPISATRAGLASGLMPHALYDLSHSSPLLGWGGGRGLR